MPPNWFNNDDWDPDGQGICDPLLAKDAHLDRWVQRHVEEKWPPRAHFPSAAMTDATRPAASFVHPQLEDWIDSGYVVNQTLAVMYMENWRRYGQPYIRRLLRMLRLPEDEYPWQRAEASFNRPVFEGEARRRYFKKGAPDTDVSRPLMLRQCPQLEAMVGQAAPWCTGGGGVGRKGRRRHGGGAAAHL